MKHLEGTIYKSAEELGISERERSELIEAIPYFLDLDPAEFNMCNWETCMCGHIAARNGRDRREDYKSVSPALKGLYTLSGSVWDEYRRERSILYTRPVDAARAIVAFLSGAAVSAY